ncbi:MAG: ABC transporter substrate-binding protein [Armatimonadetes bacterium]|nr:ABC transporter substrate-binding protein [Armatimonadota bacterium]
MSEQARGMVSRREFLARSAAVGAGLAGAAGLVGSAGTPLLLPRGAAAAPARPVTRPFVFAVRLEPISIDPHVQDSSFSQYGQRPAYEALVEYALGPDGRVGLEPALAESWQASPDGRTYTFKLRRGVRFTDGAPFNAEAAKFNFDRLFALNRGPAARIRKPKSVEAVDETTLRLTLEEPYAPFLAALTQQPLMVSPASGRRYEQRGDWGMQWFGNNTAGTGPFVLEQYVRGQHLTYARNRGYWRGWRGGFLERIVLRVVREPATQRLMLETGDADLADNIAFDDLNALGRAPGVVVQEEVNNPEIIHLCLKSAGPLANRKVRQAIAQVFDYNAFITGVVAGRARQPLGPVPFGVWALDESLQPYRRDLERARKLMAEAGFPQGGFNVTVQTISAFGWWLTRLAQILQQNLAVIGVRATIDDKPDGGTFLRAIWDRARGPDIYVWVSRYGIDDPDFEIRRLYHSELTGARGANGMYYGNKLLDKLLDEAVATTDVARRKALYVRIQRILRDDVPALWAAQMKWPVTRRETLAGYVWNPFSIGVPNYRLLSLSR